MGARKDFMASQGGGARGRELARASPFSPRGRGIKVQPPPRGPGLSHVGSLAAGERRVYQRDVFLLLPSLGDVEGCAVNTYKMSLPDDTLPNDLCSPRPSL